MDGRCDADTWSSLVESSWIFGTRPLLITSPHLRGDDVGELQSRLARLGFDPGRVDGILGPQTVAALRAFQADSGLLVDGICGPGSAQAIVRAANKSGSGPGVAVLRERERRRGVRLVHGCRLAVGQLGGYSALGHQLIRQLRSLGARTITLDEPDAALQARAANEFDADGYIGFEPSLASQTIVQYYRVPAFESVEGRSLAEHVARRLAEAGRPEVEIIGLRRPILRETRMPAVLCVLGPVRPVSDRAHELSDAVAGAVRDWLAMEPGAELSTELST